jgi:acetolactate synthase-1/2/3 large subunit
MELLDAISKVGIDYVIARSEGAACLMAGVEAQVTGRPAVVIVSMAPGITNAINGIANAFLDKLPLIVISGQHERARLPLIIRQALDSHEIVRGTTKWHATAGATIRQLLAKAFDVAATPPRGPVFLEISSEVASGEAVDERPWMPPERSAFEAPMQNDQLGGAQVDRWRAAARNAIRPVVIVGGGARSPDMTTALRELAERLRAPVFTTPSAKGVLPADDPWAAGTFVAGNIEGRLLNECDLLIAVDLDGNDFLNRPWPYAMPIVSLRNHPAAEGMLPVAVELHGHLPSLIASFARGRGDTPASVWTTEQVDRYRSAVDEALAGPDVLSVTSALRQLRDRFPSDTLVAVDAGFGRPFTALLWRSRCAGSYFSSHGLATMGYAIPAANALKLLHPERPVVAFMGDGSMLMRASEIGVASQLGLAPIYVVWADSAMTQIAVKQARRGLRNVGTELEPSSYVSIAAAFGAEGYDVHSLPELATAVDAALVSRRPSLIGVHVDASAARELFDLVRG